MYRKMLLGLLLVCMLSLIATISLAAPPSKRPAQMPSRPATVVGDRFGGPDGVLD